MRRLGLFVLVASSGIVVACSGGDVAVSESASGEVGSKIVAGTLDSATHPAVVALLLVDPSTGAGAACTGTIVKIDVPNNVGYLVTAAHCVLAEPGSGLPAASTSNLHVVTGEDYLTANLFGSDPRVHKVLDFKAEPGANPPTKDFAMIKFAGVTAATPVLPLITADLDQDLADGQEYETVGYGQTQGVASNMNSKKYKITNKLNDVKLFGKTWKGVDTITIAAPVGPKGETTCHGDSGGPWFRTINGQQYVIGVTSIGDSDNQGNGCVVGSVAARVSPQLDSFILPFLGETSATGAGGAAGAGGSGDTGGAGGDALGGPGVGGSGGDDAGAGGDTSAGGSTTVGAGGNTQPFGAGGSSPATGTGGAIGTGGHTTTGTGGAQAPGAGGVSLGFGAGGTTLAFGAGGAIAPQSNATDDSSGSSGGCSVPADRSSGIGAGILFGLAAVARAGRRRAKR